jgi:hypothetical protein
MSGWNIKASSLFILCCVVFLMLLIVVLPDIDLPDAAFHRETSPLAVHIHAKTEPAAVTVAIVFRPLDALRIPRIAYQPGALLSNSHPNFRPILLRSIRC